MRRVRSLYWFCCLFISFHIIEGTEHSDCQHIMIKRHEGNRRGHTSQNRIELFTAFLVQFFHVWIPAAFTVRKTSSVVAFMNWVCHNHSLHKSFWFTIKSQFLEIDIINMCDDKRKVLKYIVALRSINLSQTNCLKITHKNSQITCHSDDSEMGTHIILSQTK